MKIHHALQFACLLFSLPALADDLSPRQSFDRLNYCIQNHSLPECRMHVTASSVEIYDRFASYDLARCLPKSAAYVSAKTTGDRSLIRASTGEPDNKRYMRLVFSEEEGQWKFDLPESLRIGMGENWHKQLNASEQIYLMMKSQFGGRLNCDALQSLVKPKLAQR